MEKPDFLNFKGLYALTDHRLSGLSDVETVRNLLEAGVRVIQFRNKESDPRTYYEAARTMAELCRFHEAFFIVNDRVDVALAAGAQGVHLGQDDLEISLARSIVGDSLTIGISTHSPEEAERAEQEGADYIGFGPLFTTRTKNAGTARGLSMLAEVRRRVMIPVVAIGGITPENAPTVMESGADMVAVASGVLAGGRIQERVRLFEQVLEEFRRRR